MRRYLPAGTEQLPYRNIGIASCLTNNKYQPSSRPTLLGGCFVFVKILGIHLQIQEEITYEIIQICSAAWDFLMHVFTSFIDVVDVLEYQNTSMTTKGSWKGETVKNTVLPRR